MQINPALTEPVKTWQIFAQIPPHQLCFAVIDKHCSFHCIVRSYYTLYYSECSIIFQFYNVLYGLSSIFRDIHTYIDILCISLISPNNNNVSQTIQYAIIEIQPLRVLVDIDLSEIYLTFLYLFQSMPRSISTFQQGKLIKNKILAKVHGPIWQLLSICCKYSQYFTVNIPPGTYRISTHILATLVFHTS